MQRRKTTRIFTRYATVMASGVNGTLRMDSNKSFLRNGATPSHTKHGNLPSSKQNTTMENSSKYMLGKFQIGKRHIKGSLLGQSTSEKDTEIA